MRLRALRREYSRLAAEVDRNESSLLTQIPSWLLIGVFGQIEGCILGLGRAQTGAWIEPRAIAYPIARDRSAAKTRALEKNVTRHARGCQQQGPKRDEKYNHQPAHRSKLGQAYQTIHELAGGLWLAKAG